MARFGIKVAAAALAWAGAAGAQELAPTGGVVVIDPAVLEPTVLVPEPVTAGPTRLEWRRFLRPPEGREVVVTVGSVPVRTIEWAEPVEVRVRTESGVALTAGERAAIRAVAVTCRRGEPAATVERTEVNGTFVIEYRCTRLQGFEDQ